MKLLRTIAQVPVVVFQKTTVGVAYLKGYFTSKK